MISALESLGCQPPNGWPGAILRWPIFLTRWGPRSRTGLCTMCSGHRVRGCRLAYQVDVEGSGTSTFVGFSLDAQTWSSHDFRDDPSLPGLSSAADPTRVSDELRLTVEEPILHCRVQPVRYRPTSRCVLP